MALGLNAQAVASTDPGFLLSVQAAILNTAAAVYTESGATVGHKQRAALAVAVALAPAQYAPIFAGLCSATASTDKSASDAAILTAVSAVWNLVAGA